MERRLSRQQEEEMLEQHKPRKPLKRLPGHPKVSSSLLRDCTPAESPANTILPGSIGECIAPAGGSIRYLYAITASIRAAGNGCCGASRYLTENTLPPQSRASRRVVGRSTSGEATTYAPPWKYKMTASLLASFVNRSNCCCLDNREEPRSGDAFSPCHSPAIFATVTSSLFIGPSLVMTLRTSSDTSSCTNSEGGTSTGITHIPFGGGRGLVVIAWNYQVR